MRSDNDLSAGRSPQVELPFARGEPEWQLILTNPPEGQNDDGACPRLRDTNRSVGLAIAETVEVIQKQDSVRFDLRRNGVVA
jgi:hypothetical protein